MSTKTKMFVKKSLVSSCVLLVVSSVLAFVVLKTACFVSNPVNYEPIAGVSVARAEVEEMPLRLWAMNYAYEQGIDPNKFDCVINAESKWNPNAYNVNKNGSFDLGIAQWNSMHIKSGYIKLACVADPICSIKQMIAKIKKDGNFNSWYGAKNCK